MASHKSILTGQLPSPQINDGPIAGITELKAISYSIEFSEFNWIASGNSSPSFTDAKFFFLIELYKTQLTSEPTS